MAAAGLGPILNMGNVELNGGIDNESIDGYSEPTAPILRRVVWN
jgi:hypothetical protein